MSAPPSSSGAPSARLILASASPRRRSLLEGAGVAIAGIQPAHIPEAPEPGEAAVAFARRVCQEKAAAVAAALQGSPASRTWVLAADTVVHLDDEIMGKPDDDAHAAALLGRLSGRWHRVTTAWSLRHVGPGRPQSARRRTAHVTSRVRFRTLSTTDIARYIATGEGRDKAGSYAIQGVGMVLVDRLVGSYTNVVGLPVAEVLADLQPRGLAPGDLAPSPAPERP